MNTSKPFKINIPTKYHAQIFDWYVKGINRETICQKLHDELQLKTSPRTLAKLLKHLKGEAQVATDAIVAQQVQKNVLGDFERIAKLYDDVANIAEQAKSKLDHKLVLSCVDRLTKLLQIKMAVNMSD